MRPPFVLVGGPRCSSRASLEYLQSWGGDLKDAPTHLVEEYYDGVSGQDKKEVVVLSQVLSDDVNVGFTFDSVGLDYVASVNGQPVADMEAFVEALRLFYGGRIKLPFKLPGGVVAVAAGWPPRDPLRQRGLVVVHAARDLRAAPSLPAGGGGGGPAFAFPQLQFRFLETFAEPSTLPLGRRADVARQPRQQPGQHRGVASPSATATRRGRILFGCAQCSRPGCAFLGNPFRVGVYIGHPSFKATAAASAT